MRVLSLPGREYPFNRYFRLFVNALEEAGVEIASGFFPVFRLDVINVHFPEHYVTEQHVVNAVRWSSYYSSLFLVSKVLKKKIVWSVHDVKPFKNRHAWLLAPYMKLFKRLVDGHVFLSRVSQEEFYLLYPDQRSKPFVFAPHGPYPIDGNDIEASRLKSAIRDKESTFLVGYLGSIKKYKNVKALTKLPLSLDNGKLVRVVLAGQADSYSAAEVEAVCSNLGSKHVWRWDRKLSDFELSSLLKACDVTFLPYDHGWNSGMALLSLSNHRPVIGSNLPVFCELKEEFGERWIQTYSTEHELSACIESISKNPITNKDCEELQSLMKKRDFDATAASVISLYHRVIAGSRSGGKAESDLHL